MAYNYSLSCYPVIKMLGLSINIPLIPSDNPLSRLIWGKAH